ncbi:hypothetical protein NSQ77_19890 [Oceanobacillus sp. FSL K6-2867]
MAKKTEIILVREEFAGKVDLNEYFRKLLIEAIKNDEMTYDFKK